MGPLALTYGTVLKTQATPAEVWRALETPGRWPDVLPDLIEARIAPDGRLAAGTIIATVARPGTKAVDMSYRVVAAQAPRRVVWASRIPGLQAQTELGLRQKPDGTRITASLMVEADTIVGRLLMWAFRKRYGMALMASMTFRLQALLTLAERMAAEEIT